jgi:hypothetical protein
MGLQEMGWREAALIWLRVWAFVNAVMHLRVRENAGKFLTSRGNIIVFMELVYYSSLHCFWPLEELAELPEGPTVCHEVARGGCLLACNFSVTRKTVLIEAERRTGPNISVH